MISPGLFRFFTRLIFLLSLSCSFTYQHITRERGREIERWREIEGHLHLQLAARGASRCTLRRRGQQQNAKTASAIDRLFLGPLHAQPTHTHAYTHGAHTGHTQNTHQVDPGGWRGQRRRRRRGGTRQKRNCADTNAMAKRWQLIWVTLSTAPQAAATVAAAAAAAAASAAIAGGGSCVPLWP